MLPLPYIEKHLGSWYENINDYDIAIAISYPSTYKIFKAISNKNKKCRKILYWWDPTGKTLHPKYVDEKYCERWSFCKRDCDTFHMKYNPTFYYKSGVEHKICKDYKYDLFFVGAIGGWFCSRFYSNRISILQKLELICKKYDLTYFIKILYPKFYFGKRLFKLDKFLDAEKYYYYFSHSKTIIDIVDDKKPWLTLRPIEALYYGKKIITNNIEVISEKFYDKNLVFILGKDDINDLPKFVNTNYIVDNSILSYYSIEKWFDRFVE